MTPIRVALALYIPFSHSGVAYRRDAIRGIGGYSEAWDGVEDLELWIRAAGEACRPDRSSWRGRPPPSSASGPGREA